VLFPLGLLAVLQAVFLPGYLLIRPFGLHRGGLARALILSFASSLVVNHLLVFALTAGHAYRPSTLYVVVALEVAAIAWLVLRDRTPVDSIDRDLTRWRTLIPALAARRPPAALAGFASILAFLGVFAWYLWRGAWGSGQVFSAWDPVVSWNRWAIDWAEDRLPFHTWHYPQLLPTTISLTYVMTGGAQVQFFAKAILALFPLGMLLACWDLMLRRQDARYATAGALGGILMALALRGFLLAGLAEEPVSAMTFLCFYLLLLGERTERWRDAKACLLFAAICAGGAALTKQAGWHVAAIFPLLAWLLVIRRVAPPHDLVRLRAVIVCVVVVLLLAGPWYVYRQLNPSDSEFAFIFGPVHAGRTYAERAQWSMHLLTTTLEMPAWVFLAVAPGLLLLSLLDRVWRWITVLFTVPFIAAWVLFFSYDLRNIAAAIFPAAAGMAIGIGAAIQLLLKRPSTNGAAVQSPSRWRAGWPLAAGACVAVVFLAVGPLRDSRLLDRQRRQQAEIYSPEINHAVLQEAEGEGLRGRIISNYQILPYLPGMRDAYVANPLNKDSAASVERLLRDSAIRYVLYYGWPPHPDFLSAGIPPVRFTPIRTGTCPNGASYMFLSVDRP
jgi:hypothetical protein